MSDTKEKLVSFKVYPSDADWAAAEQRRMKRMEHRSVTQADLFARLREAWCVGHAGQAATTAPVVTGAGALDTLQRVEAILKELQSGDRTQDSSSGGAGRAGEDRLIDLIEAIEKGNREGAAQNRRTAKALERLQRSIDGTHKGRGSRSA